MSSLLIVFCCIMFSVSTPWENFGSVRKFFLCYRDQKKWIKIPTSESREKFCQPEAEGRGLVMFPKIHLLGSRFTFSDQDNIEKLFELFKNLPKECMKQKTLCNRVLFRIFPIFLSIYNDQVLTGYSAEGKREISSSFFPNFTLLFSLIILKMSE